MDRTEKVTKRNRYWQAEYKKYQESGQTQSEYCKVEGIPFWSFKAGIQEARRGGMILESGRRKRKRPSLQFVQMRVIEAEGPAEPYCEIRFSGKPGIRIETQESVGLMRELISGLSA